MLPCASNGTWVGIKLCPPAQWDETQDNVRVRAQRAARTDSTAPLGEQHPGTIDMHMSRGMRMRAPRGRSGSAVSTSS